MKYKINRKKVLEDFIFLFITNKTINDMSEGTEIMVDDSDYEDLVHDVCVILYKLMEKHATIL